jgi:tRNA(Ile)-lysidine synthase
MQLQPAHRPNAVSDAGPAAGARALAAETARLAGAGHGPVALAVSGGADSLALLKLGAEAFPGRVHALSVDHGLRPEAAAECAMVARLAAGLGVPHHSLTVGLAAGGNVQARARDARYAAMAGWCRANDVALLLTAHHADDQAETLLMRLARGSGVAGLAGIRAVVDMGGVALLRPLLGQRRVALAAVVRAAGWTPVDDPSNRDPAFDRTRARALLAETAWLPAERLCAAAANLAQAEAALAWAEARAFATRATQAADALLLDPDGLPDELQRRLLARGLQQFGPPAEGPALQRLLARLSAGGAGTLGAVRADRLPDGRWRLRRAPRRRTG